MKDSWKTNPNQWLDTYDILRVMKQYENKCKMFEFLGVFPADVMSENVCMMNSMCDFNLERLLTKGKTEIGVVFNLDNHNQPGSHWVAVYANFNKSSNKLGVFYYDSFGFPPPPKIKAFTLLLREQAKHVFDNVTMQKFIGRFNIVQHQYRNTECGMYSMIFIIMCLEKTKDDFYAIRDIIPTRSDSIINQFRKQLYR
jgi:hypothetical protein